MNLDCLFHFLWHYTIYIYTYIYIYKRTIQNWCLNLWLEICNGADKIWILYQYLARLLANPFMIWGCDIYPSIIFGVWNQFMIFGWLVVWVLWHINLCRLFNAKSIFMKIVLFQTIQFSMSTQFNCQKHFYFKLFSLVKQF